MVTQLVSHEYVREWLLNLWNCMYAYRIQLEYCILHCLQQCLYIIRCMLIPPVFAVVAIDSLRCVTRTTDDRVCGDDGQTYDSLCEMLRRGLGAVQRRHSSRCDDPQCTSNPVSAVLWVHVKSIQQSWGSIRPQLHALWVYMCGRGLLATVMFQF